MTTTEARKFILDNIDGFEFTTNLSYPEGNTRYFRYTNQRVLEHTIKCFWTDKDSSGNIVCDSEHFIRLDIMVGDFLGSKNSEASKHLNKILITVNLDMI